VIPVDVCLATEFTITRIWDTLRLLGDIVIHRNCAVYVSLNTNANPTLNPNPNPNANPNANPISDRNAFLWRPINYNLAREGTTRILMKIFRTSSSAIVKDCQCNYNFFADSVTD